jgi:nitrate reductase NapA
MSVSRRQFLEIAAAASALAALHGTALDGLAAEVGGADEWVKSVCRYCGTGCGLYIGVKNGKVVAVFGDKDNHNAGFLCVKGALLPQIMFAPDRLQHPLIRKNGKLEHATWDEAMDLVTNRFRETIQKFGSDSVGFYGSGQGLTEETYVANKLFKAGIRTNNVEGNPRLCMASAVGGYTTTFGKDEPMGCYEDIDHADVFFLIGSNTAEAHPIIWDRILRRKRGNSDVKIIVADPRQTPTARAADLYISFIPGTDLAILNGMANVLVAENLIDQEFISRHVVFGEGAEVNKSWDAYRESLATYTPEKVASISGCRAEDIFRVARWFGAQNRTAMSMWTMGLNQRTRGVWANNLVHNLHLITGKIGSPGSTPLSLTGQPNACGGVRDGGALAPLLPYGRAIANAKDRADVENLWSVPPGTIQPKPGLFTVDMFRALEEGKLRALYVMCTNPGQSLPNVERYRKAMQNRDVFLVVTEAFHPTRTSELAHVVLPAALWAEKEGVYGCTERRYQLLAKAVEPLGEARPDLDILIDFGRRLGYGHLVSFKTPEDVWTEILKMCKGTGYDFSGMTRERLRKSHGLLWPMPSTEHPGTKRRYVRGEDPFVTADHPTRMKFYGRPDNKAVVWIRPQSGPEETTSAAYPFYYTTMRVIEHWHTGTMTRNVKELRHAKAEAVAEINPVDGQKLGIHEGDRVRIVSRRGTGEFRAKLTDQSAPGLIAVHMHDPDHMCNVATIDAVDPISRQPEYKIAAVRLERI